MKMGRLQRDYDLVCEERDAYKAQLLEASDDLKEAHGVLLSARRRHGVTHKALLVARNQVGLVQRALSVLGLATNNLTDRIEQLEAEEALRAARVAALEAENTRLKDEYGKLQAGFKQFGSLAAEMQKVVSCSVLGYVEHAD